MMSFFAPDLVLSHHSQGRTNLSLVFVVSCFLAMSRDEGSFNYLHCTSSAHLNNKIGYN